MKFGKKNQTNAGDQANGSGPEGRREVSLTRTPVIQSVLALGGAVLLPLLLLVLVVAPAEERAFQQVSEDRVDVLKSRFDQHLSYLHEIVAGFAAQETARAAATQGEQEQVAQVLAQTLPGSRAVFLFAPGDFSQPPGADFELSFASIDLARQAERLGATRMDAFQRDDEWLIQVAAPILATGEEISGGSVLVIFDSEVMDPVFAVTAGAMSGRVELRQRVGDRHVPIFSSGQGQGEALSRNLDISGWSVRYVPDEAAQELIPRAWLWGLPIAVGLLVVVGIWGTFGQLQKQLREDLSVLSKWAQKAFAGERVRAPVVRLPMVNALGETLMRLAQSVGRRATQSKRRAAAANSRKKEAPAEPAPAPKEQASDSVEEEVEPLFQDDGLDIDMLDGDEDVLGLGGAGESEGMSLEETPLPQVEVPAGIFRAYDIRGQVGDSLTPEIVRVIGQAIGTEARQREQQQICVGYDGRHSSPELADALMQGIISSGVDVIDVGRVPTPVLYFAAHYLETGSGVMVTGSHNPPDYNGLKMVLGGETLAGDAIQKLLERIRNHNMSAGQGSRTQEDVRSAYVERIVNDIAVAAPLRVVVDAGNGVAGELGPELIRELGCEVHPLFCEIDGSFPNHHPDPGKPENLEALIAAVREQKADLGIAFDGDGDRIGVVTNSGKIIWPDRLLMLFARDVVSRNPGADIIYDVKCSRRLATVINEFGGRPVMWKTGHSWIKAKMKSMGALLAGEMSGHIFFQERWYGFDDGIYAAARLLEILGIEDREADEIFAEFPEDVSTPEINLAVPDDQKFALIERLAKGGEFGEASITDIDGLRVDYPDGWGLCRASNTTPNLVLRFESETEEGLERIKAIFREQLAKAEPSLEISF